MNQRGSLPIKPYVLQQEWGWLWPMDCRLRTPALYFSNVKFIMWEGPTNYLKKSSYITQQKVWRASVYSSQPLIPTLNEGRCQRGKAVVPKKALGSIRAELLLCCSLVVSNYFYLLEFSGLTCREMHPICQVRDFWFFGSWISPGPDLRSDTSIWRIPAQGSPCSQAASAIAAVEVSLRMYYVLINSNAAGR